MEKESDKENSVVGSERSLRCGLSCLGPLTFHSQAVGDNVRLSQGCRLAERTGKTFRNGLVFISRPVKVQERILLRVEKDLMNCQGALRVGFTNVPPSARSQPLPDMAIPNLTDISGHWAAPVHESYCQAGSELEFWVSNGGSLYITSNNIRQHKLLTGVDLSKPLWAMIDIYGQTCSIFLLGSEKRELFRTRRSCPAPERPTSLDVDNPSRMTPAVSNLHGDSEQCISCLDMEVPAVVGSERSLRCGLSCLGPLTFHSQAVGDNVRLSQGCRLAERTGKTFRNGLVFISRPVKVQERIRLRVEKDLMNCQGALRVGFTNVPPSARSQPLPDMAIPNLTDISGHWAAPVHESYCQAGSVLEFWVSNGGSLYITSNNIRQHKLLTGVDLSKPLWAMIDIYGQTCSIFLLGSEKRELFHTRRSCPAPERPTSLDVDNPSRMTPAVSNLHGDSEQCISCLDMEVPAVVGSERSLRCGLSCLGPLTFHSQAVGDNVRLSQGCRLAERTGKTFRNGLVFISRPVEVQERILLRVEKDLMNCQGALRVGFTNVPPSARSQPLPDMAIPNLTDISGHWAAPVHESYCQAGSVLEFWVSNGGSLYITSNNIRQHKLLTGVDLSKPLWAMIDIYGQTCSIFLLGSEKRELFHTRRSCPAPERPTSLDVDNPSRMTPAVSNLHGDSEQCISCLDMEVPAVVGSERSLRCGLSCLGPLTFHSQAVGDNVRLSQGCRLAERTGKTFRNGLVFISRPVEVQERILLRVEKDLMNCQGALRVGFTNVPPSARSQPLPDMAIPNLTYISGHWAAPVHESYCQAGSELEFWVSNGGSLYITSNNIRQHKLLTGVDLSKPLWAMIDIYGQTCSIFLLGSEKRELFRTRRSCPAPERPTSLDVDIPSRMTPVVSNLHGNSEQCISCLDMEVPAGESRAMSCVVCMAKEARITLPCGHRCLCDRCAPKVCQQFGTCPLCRRNI